MQKNIKFFITNNTKIINNNLRNKKYILIADRQRFDSSIRQSLISKIFNDKGYTPVLATRKPNSIFSKIYESFGLKKKFNTNLLENKFFLIKNSPEFFLKSIFILVKYQILGFEKFKINLKIDNIKIGPQILDQYYRNDQSYLKGFFTLKFYKILLTAFYKIRLIQNYIKKNKIKYTVVSSDTYLNESSIIFKISQELKLINIRSVRKTAVVCKNYKDYNEHLYTIQKSDLKRKSFSINKVNKYIRKRFNGEIEHLDVKNAFRNKEKRFDKKKLFKFFKLNNKKYKNVILFAPHVFADSCSTWGSFPFLNYYQFFTETINRMKDIKNIAWIIKPHPTRHFWKEDYVIKEYLKKNNFSNIYFCPDKISTRDIIKCADTVVTGRGTIGVEAATFGKRSITCGSSLYRNLNISFNSNNKKEFFKVLNFKNYKFSLNKKQIRIAKKSLFFMGSFRWKQDSHIIPNMATNHKNVDFYFKKINNNLKKYNFINDKYYLGLIQKISPFIR